MSVKQMKKIIFGWDLFLILLGIGILFCSFRLFAKETKFKFFSGSFSNGRYIPVKFAMKRIKKGKNISPSLIWKNPPKGTKSFVITCIDHAPIARRWVHWMIINIPEGVSEIRENASGRNMPDGCKELENSFGFEGYGGPQPPRGSGPHKYVFTIYALKEKNIRVNSDFISEKKLKKIIKGKVLAKSSFYGIFER